MHQKVSIITPTFNSEKYLLKTIQSVISQSYLEWEMIIVDDCSTDNTRKILEDIIKEEKRIKLVILKENSGAATARNIALEYATGRFIAYLDADDIWYSKKLEKQVNFMLNEECGFSCVSYEVIDDAGRSLNKSIHMKDSLDYRGYLTNNLIQTVGVMVDLHKVKKESLIMPNLRRGQDAATWFQILKSGNNCIGISEILAQYRRTDNSLSSNKLKAIKRTWFLYREVEKLKLPYACYCFFRYAMLAVWKRTYRTKK